MRPQRVRAIGSSSGWVTWKKPCSDTSTTRFHCASDMPAIGASSWMPALLTTTCTGPPASNASTAPRVASPSATSNATASALPPAATIAATTASARARFAFACTITCRPSAASRRQIAPPMSPLPPVTKARFIASPQVGWSDYALRSELPPPQPSPAGGGGSRTARFHFLPRLRGRAGVGATRRNEPRVRPSTVVRRACLCCALSAKEAAPVLDAAGLANPFPPPVAASPALSALQATRAGIDLDAHLAGLAESGGLGGFLDQTGDALDLAKQSPVFAEQLDPLLGDLRGALSRLDTAGLDAATREDVDATLSRLDDHLGPVTDPDPAPEVPGGGLEAHENAGGHLIERHVGKSEQWLIDRVKRENVSAASSFRDLPEAERFVAETLALHQDRIDAWVGGQGGNRLVIDARFDASTGISGERGDSSAQDVFSVRLVLERSNRLEDIGYRIVTGYPSAP